MRRAEAPPYSSVLINWMQNWNYILQIQQNYRDEILTFFIQYSPQIGNPSTPFYLNAPILPFFLINQTLPSTIYQVQLIAQFKNNKNYLINQNNFFSSLKFKN